MPTQVKQTKTKLRSVRFTPAIEDYMHYRQDAFYNAIGIPCDFSKMLRLILEKEMKNDSEYAAVLRKRGNV